MCITTKPSNAYMSRPTVTHAMILEAATQVAKRVDGDAETIAEHFRPHMDGYELARELDRYYGWDLNMSDVEELDCMSSIVDELQREAEKTWFADNNIQPPLPIGTRITEGVIEAVDEYSPGKYLVKENGCTQQGRWLLVNFEEAEAA